MFILELENLIINGRECDYLDFKAEIYRDNKEALIKDIMAMANSVYEGKKYIIMGVKDYPNGDRDIIGLQPGDIMDNSNYQQIIQSNIEPQIYFEYYTYKHHGKKLGIIELSGTYDRPYLMKKQFRYLKEGFCLIRKGSMQIPANRNDYDNFYINNGKFEAVIYEPFLSAGYVKTGCAELRVILRNITNYPVTIVYGELLIKDKNNNILSRHIVYGFEKFIGTEFSINIPPNNEKIGYLYLGFESSDCLRLNIDEYGMSNQQYVFDICLVDTLNNEYVATCENGMVIAKGDFLWKVKLKNKAQENNKSSLINIFHHWGKDK